MRRLAIRHVYHPYFRCERRETFSIDCSSSPPDHMHRKANSPGRKRSYFCCHPHALSGLRQTIFRTTMEPGGRRRPRAETFCHDGRCATWASLSMELIANSKVKKEDLAQAFACPLLGAACLVPCADAALLCLAGPPLAARTCTGLAQAHLSRTSRWGRHAVL